MTDEARCAQANTNTHKYSPDTRGHRFTHLLLSHSYLCSVFFTRSSKQLWMRIKKIKKKKKKSGRQRLKVPIMSVAPAVRRVKE